MLKVQEYLSDYAKTLGPQGALNKLNEELAIRVATHEWLPLVILNYDQLDSPKTHPIVRECRGLVLEMETWKVVARAFERFFNLGEAGID